MNEWLIHTPLQQGLAHCTLSEFLVQIKLKNSQCPLFHGPGFVTKTKARPQGEGFPRRGAAPGFPWTLSVTQFPLLRGEAMPELG